MSSSIVLAQLDDAHRERGDVKFVKESDIKVVAAFACYSNHGI